MLNVVFALLLAGVGLAVFGYLASILWQAVAGPLLGFMVEGQMKRYRDSVARGDAALARGEIDAALGLFAKSVFTSPVRSAKFAAEVQKHHTGILSRFIAASERGADNVGLMSLAVVDRALRQRKELQSSYVAALQTGERGRQRALEQELRANGNELRQGFDKLRGEVLATQRGPALH